MAVSNKIANEQLRTKWLEDYTKFLEDNDEQVLRVKSNEIAIPVIDCNGEEKFLAITFKVPTGAKDEPYDGYVEAEDYAHKLKEKAIKAKKKEEEKKKKIEHDKKMREEKNAE